MERKIQWNSGCFDEIDLVYGKAAEKEVTEKILSELEDGALAEARAYSDKIVVDGRPLTPQQFDTLPDSMKEQVMYNLSGMGLSAFSAPLTEPKISVRLSPHIQFVRCCTAFSILNRLEKLDGAFNMLHPQATLEIQAPLGGKKGLVHIEMLISFLYPWLKVTEISSNEIAVQPVQEQPKQEHIEAKPLVATSTPVQATPAGEAKTAKPSFWERLFGKKNKNATKVPPVVQTSPEANAQAKEVKPVAVPVAKSAVPASPAVQAAPAATPKEHNATTVLVIPEGTKEVKLSEYKGQRNITQVVIPEGVESINAQAFSGCENLETVNFPKSLKFIGFSAFAHCKKLKQVQLPEGLESIDNSAFFECVNLEKINFPASLKRMGEHVFSTCTKLKSAGPYGSGASVEFGATNKLINDLFGSCHYLERVSLPDGLEIIGSTVFRGCKYLAKINLPASLKRIGDQAFAGCEKLVSAGPPNSGCSIEFGVSDRILNNMFMNCKNLTSVQLPAGITVIGESAFYNCKSLQRITVPKGVEEIGARAFEFCGGLKHLDLPDSVVKIGENAFRACDQLANQDGFIIVRSVLYGCLNLNDTIVIPQGVTTIESDAFVLGTSISNDVTTTIIIPESVVRITHHRGFLRCKKLETVIISESASDEVKQVAKIIADRTEEQRKDREKSKPVFIRSSDQLWVFRSANRDILSEIAYQAIISKFQELRDKVIGKGGKTDTRWSESAIMISLYDEDSHWVGHDDTATESIELKFERLSKWDEPSEWTSECDLPCEGAYQYLNKSKDEGDSWSYSVMSHKAWLLKAPFGLPGVWSFEYISKHDR